MKILVCISLLALCFVPCHTDDNATATLTRNRRIVAGKVAPFGDFPFIAQLIWFWHKPKLTSITCSATAITKDYVITAASCYQLIVDDNNKHEDTPLDVKLNESYGNTQIVLNSNDKFWVFRQKRNGVKLFVHSAFMHVSTMFDINIALIKTNGPFNFNYPKTNFLRLPILAKPFDEDQLPETSYLQCFGVGAGRIRVDEEESKKVSSFKVNVGGVKHCKYLQKIFNKRDVHFDSYYLCAKSVNARQDICKGDLGSALICDGLLAGVMSQRLATHSCQVGGDQFTMYTAVGSKQILDWIKIRIPDLPALQEITVPDPQGVAP